MLAWRAGLRPVLGLRYAGQQQPRPNDHKFSPVSLHSLIPFDVFSFGFPVNLFAIRLRRRHAIETLAAVFGRVGEVVLAGTIVGEGAELRPVGERQHHVGGGPDGEGCALIVGETKPEGAVALNGAIVQDGRQDGGLGDGNFLPQQGDISRAVGSVVGGESVAHHGIVDPADGQPRRITDR